MTEGDPLLKLIYSKATSQVVVVAGQAVNFWAKRFSEDAPGLSKFYPFTSRDLDLLAHIADAYRLAKEAHAKMQRPRKSAASPVVANVQVSIGNVTRSVQFLRNVGGVTNTEITEYAIPFVRKDVTLYFSDPITMLKAKLHNLVALPQADRNDVRHVEILRLCVPVFVDGLLLAADETDRAAKQSLENIRRVLKLSESPMARRIPVENRFDWKVLIPIRRLNKVRNARFKNFREQEFERWRRRISDS